MLTLRDYQRAAVEGDVTAQANLLTQLSSNVNEVSANATFRMGTYVVPSGWNARIGMEVRGGTDDSFKSAGLFLDVTSTQARIALIAEQIVFSNGTQFFKPFVIQNNVMYGEGFVMDWAKIVNVQIQWAQIQNAVIDNLVVKTSNLDFNAVTQPNRSPFNQLLTGTSGVVAALTISNPAGNAVVVGCNVATPFTASTGSSINLKLTLWNMTTGSEIVSNTASVTGGQNSLPLGACNIDFTAITGTNVYGLQITVITSSGTNSIGNTVGDVKALVWKR